MRAIIGLGNPGSEYAETRHNIGFAVLDSIARRFGEPFVPGKGEYQSALVKRDPEILLVKPIAFMNNSGNAVRDVLGQFGLQLEDLLVVVDDFHLSLGKIRLRANGSSGGHNGIASVIWQLQTPDFARLRCGIEGGHDPMSKQSRAEFVLSPFARDELKCVQRMTSKAASAAVIVAQENIQAAMNYLSGTGN